MRKCTARGARHLYARGPRSAAEPGRRVAPMSTVSVPVPVATPAAVADLIDEGRWSDWKARGRADREQTTIRMRVVAAVIAVGLAGWLTRAILAIP